MESMEFNSYDKSYILIGLIDNLCTIGNELFKDRDYSKLLSRFNDQKIHGMTLQDSITLLYEISASLICEHIDYDYLAGRLVIFSRMLKLSGIETIDVNYTILVLQGNRETRIKSMAILSPEVKSLFMNFPVSYFKDFSYDYIGAMSLNRSYLLDNETIQDMLLRISIGIHGGRVTDVMNYKVREDIMNTYQLMSDKRFIHASPTLFYAGTMYNQLSSCYLLNIKGDSLDKIYETLSDTAIISKYAGGIGISVSSIRSRGSAIGNTGVSNGIVPMLKVFNETAKYVDQGGGKRKGAFAIYLEPWHADIQEFLKLGDKHGTEQSRASDLFYGLWTPDLFMERVVSDQDWSLFCPHEIYQKTGKYLWNLHGDEFRRLYISCERAGLQRKIISARGLWDEIQRSQIESGSPYILYKDTCNSRSNHKHLGTIKSSNLCTEIIQYTDDEEIAVCTLSSVSLPAIIKSNHYEFSSVEDKIDWNLLRCIVRQITVNLDRIVDINNYPVSESKTSADRHRAIGIGIQGLSDVFCILSLPFDSPEASLLNRLFAEHIYYYSLEKSIELAREHGPYDTFEGSEFSKGILQFDYTKEVELTLDWDRIRLDILKYGIRNSLLTAYMPTASTSQILGNNEGFEPYSSNLYNRKALSGDYAVINKHLVRDLMKIGKWSRRTYENIMSNNGSVQHIEDIPESLKRIYRTTWELPIGPQLMMARDRGLFIDQSQSMSLYFTDDESKNDKLTSALINGWKLGLKTGIYYVRTRPAVHPNKITISQVCTIREDECISCQG